MSDNPPHDLTHDLLRAIRADLAEIKEDISELTESTGILEEQGSSLWRRVDRIGGDIELIKRRLGLIDTPA